MALGGGFFKWGLPQVCSPNLSNQEGTYPSSCTPLREHSARATGQFYFADGGKGYVSLQIHLVSSGYASPGLSKRSLLRRYPESLDQPRRGLLGY